MYLGRVYLVHTVHTVYLVQAVHTVCEHGTCRTHSTHLLHLLVVQPEHSLIQVPHSPVYQLGALAACATAEVILLNQGSFETYGSIQYTNRK